ncbi:hypothetical protein LF41_3013 [Lysobacter dokdonensis DS-58]|uniref:Uncharacterized protein n=2 Tax=Noviluteimonas TaxID=3382693 RepID=A0A0A2WHS1_9GAMM|nr:hypothetical protein LF41_3013 [Lysobacter dokdonensis DS-58]
MGASISLMPESVECFEVTETQAHRWAREELSESLDQLKSGLDTTLGEWQERLGARSRRSDGVTQTTNEAAPALLAFFKRLPGVIGQSLSGDPQRLDSARDTLAELQQRLNDAGIDVDDRVKNFADRLASIRTEAEATKPPDDAA